MRSKESVSGIYEVRNKTNGKRYIGSSVDMEQRWSIHRSSLRGGYHSNEHLQRAWVKYGEDAFEFKVLEECLPSSLTMREQGWLSKFQAQGLTYNMAVATDAPMRGRKLSPESRKKISKALKGHRRTERECQAIRERAARDYPEFIHESGKVAPAGHNLAELCAEHDLLRSCMYSVKSGRVKTHRGWMLRCNAIQRPDGSWTVKKKTNAVPYPAFVHTSGETIPPGSNLTALCRERNLSRSHMCSVKNGQRKTHRGWMLLSQARQLHDGTWYIEHGNARPHPAFVNKDGRTIPAGVNLSRTCRENGLNEKELTKVKTKRRKLYNGWRLVDEHA